MTLPLPGSPASSWAMYRARLKSIFSGADPRVCTAFWLFGLINNVLYVIVLSAALDLVGPSVTKGVVLLADVIPSFVTKLCAPYFIHAIPYYARIKVFVGLSACGMLLIALTPSYTDGGTISHKMAGVVLASVSSGGGELSFLGLTHFYGPFSLAAWGSGTGGAGLIGAGPYALATTSLGFSVRTTLLASACLPAIMVLGFFVILPRGPLHRAKHNPPVITAWDPEDEYENRDSERHEDEGLLAADDPSKTFTSRLTPGDNSYWEQFKANLKRSRSLFFPLSGVAPTLLFPLKKTPFKHFRAFYPTYNAIYQFGVVISRSSTPFFRVHNLYFPSFLQILNLVVLTMHALFGFIPNVYVIFVIIFWEGLLGGLVYVNTFAEITDRVPPEDCEFSLGATTVSDSAGICAAGFIGMAFEVWLCNWQVSQGRDYFTKL